MLRSHCHNHLQNNLEAFYFTLFPRRHMCLFVCRPCHPDWSETYYVAQAGLKLIEIHLLLSPKYWG